MVTNPMSKQNESVWGNTCESQKAKISNKGIVHLEKICKITGDTNSAATSVVFTTIFNNAVHYVEWTDGRYIR